VADSSRSRIGKGMHSQDDPAIVWLKRIFGLSVAMLLLLGLTAWEVHGTRMAVEAMEIEMPTMTVQVKIQPPGSPPPEPYEIPLTTTQKEFDSGETENQWIDRTMATAANIKARIEESLE
jgi:hypothetical protein